MANTPISGNKYVLRFGVGPASGGAPTFLTLVCLTNNGWQAVDNQIDTGSKCNAGWNSSIAGNKGWTMSGEAQAIPGVPDSGTMSFERAFQLWKDDTTFPVEMINVDDPNDAIKGDAKITDLSKSAPYNDITTFSITLTGQGEPMLATEG